MSSEVVKMKGNEEILELLRPLFYAIPKVSETFKEKYFEFVSKEKGGMKYSTEDLLEEGLKRIGDLVEYIVEDAGRGGLIQKYLMKNVMKNASGYFMSTVKDMLLGNER